jgi:hypothetical protein
LACGGDLDRRNVGAGLHRGRARIRAHRFDDRGFDRSPVEGERQRHQFGRAQQALDVFAQPEDRRPAPGVVNTHVVEDQRAALQAV